MKIILHVKIENKKIIKEYKKQGYFLYGNHTQTIGDIFIPALVCSPKRIYVVISQANLGVFCLGKILPMLGALPIPNGINDMRKFKNAIHQRIDEKKCVVIYPESHIWPFYTKIRPYKKGSFRFQINENVPAFCITTTYYKRKFSKKPGIRVFIDGPFLPNNELNKNKQEEIISKEIYDCMISRSKNSSYEYIKYLKLREE